MRFLPNAFPRALKSIFFFLLVYLIIPGTAGAAQTKPPSVKVHGQQGFSTGRVVDLVPVPDPVPDWDREEWRSWAEDAALLVREGYREQGYFDAGDSVLPVFSDSMHEYAPPVRIEVRVSEGPRYRFGRVRLDLPPGAFPHLDTAALAARPGRAFNKKILFSDRREILQFYGNAGFLKATAAESLFYDLDLKAVNVVFKVKPGAALVFDTLLLRIVREGDTSGLAGKTRPSVLRGLFPTRPGDTLSLRDINTFERKLRSTRVFNFVRLGDSAGGPASNGNSTVLLSAEEKVPGEKEITGYWETQYGFGTDLTWSHANLGGRLQEGRLGLTLAQRKQSVLAGYSAPLLFGTSVRFDNDFVSNWYQDSRLQTRSPPFEGDFDISNQSRLSRSLTTWARAVSGAELFGKSEKLDSATRARDFNLNFLNSLYLQDLDNPINPTQGERLALTWGNGGPLFNDGELALFQATRHNWLEAEAAGYLPVGRWMVMALRLDGGRFYGQGGINSARFYLGGPRSVRSRDWRSVCPQVTADKKCIEEGIEPAYVLGSMELRLQPFFKASTGVLGHLSGVQVVPFVDYGNVWEVGKAVTETGKGRAVGLGLRYGFLTLFNIRVDYAQDPQDAGQNRWILDLAQAF